MVGIGLNVLVNIVSDTTHATIDGADVEADGTGSWVIVRRTRIPRTTNSGGALGVGAFAGGAGVNVDIVKNDTEALVTDSQPAAAIPTEVDAGNGVEISALNRTNVTTTAIGVAIGIAGVAGSASGVKSSSTTIAAVDDAKVNAMSGPIDVAANDAVAVTFMDGAGAGGVAGIGGAVAVGIINDTTIAALAGAGTLSGGDTDVEADSAETLSTQAGMAAFGLGAGIGGTVAVMSLSPTTTASVDSKSDVTANGSLNVNANDVLQLPNDVIGTAAVGGIGGEGFTVEVITVHDTVDAHIADSTASGTQGVSVEANGQRTFDATVVAFGAGVGAGIDGAVSVLTLGADLDSTSSGQVIQTQSSVNNSLLNSQGVSGLNTSNNQSLAQPGSIGAQLQEGAQANLFTVSLASGTSTTGGTQAYLGSGAKVNSSGGGLTVSATESVNLDDKIGGGALGLIAAAGASVGIANINSDTEADIAKGATVSVARDVTVSSTYSDNVNVSSYGAQGSIGIALGAVYASVDDTSTQTSYIGGDVTRADQVTIEAQGPNPQGLATPPPNHDLTTYDFGFTGAAAAAAGATVGTSENTGSTSAYLDTGAQLGSSVGGLAITATSGTLATTNMLITSAALLVGVRVNSATTTITPTISAYIGQGDTVHVAGNVDVAATSALAEGHSDAQSYGGGAVDVGVGTSSVTTSPVVKGYIDQNSTVNAGGDISVTSTGDDQTSPPVDPTGAFNPSTAVDTQTGTITFPVDLSDGSQVQYQADPTTNSPIGGLNSDQIQLNVDFVPRSEGDAILLYNGQDWTTYGFEPGLVFTVTDPTDTKDDGTFTVASVSLNVLTLTASNVHDSAPLQTANFTLNRVYRIMNPSLTVSGLNFANSASGNTITRTSGSWVTDGFVAGEQITISGTNDRGTYTIKGVTDSTLTLVNVNDFPWTLAGTLTNSVTITSQGAFRFGETFDASQVNTASDTITFASPDDFQTGDAVQIDTEGNPALGNIDASQTYYVRTVDAYTIQLCASLGDALATPDEVSPGEYNSSTSSFDIPELGVNQSAPIPVTYNAPSPTTFYASDVDFTYDNMGTQSNNPDMIYVNGNDLTDYETVTFSFTGQVSPIEGLTQGEQFGVLFASTETKPKTSPPRSMPRISSSMPSMIPR